MKLSEIFNHLSSGELSQVALGQQVSGELPDQSQVYLISSINLGLTALHKRFFLREGEVEFELSSAGTVYNLQQDDIHKIEKVFTAEGYELSLNNAADPYSCYTPSMGTLRVPDSFIYAQETLPDNLKTTMLKVVYRANHPIIGEVSDPERYNIALPYSHLEALLYFVASRVHNPIGMVNEFNAGNSWAAKYEVECARLEGQGNYIDIQQDNTKLSQKGFV